MWTNVFKRVGARLHISGQMKIARSIRRIVSLMGKDDVPAKRIKTALCLNQKVGENNF